MNTLRGIRTHSFALAIFSLTTVNEANSQNIGGAIDFLNQVIQSLPNENSSNSALAKQASDLNNEGNALYKLAISTIQATSRDQSPTIRILDQAIDKYRQAESLAVDEDSREIARSNRANAERMRNTALTVENALRDSPRFESAPSEAAKVEPNPTRDENWKLCESTQNEVSYESRIAGCTALIDGGKEDAKELTIATFNRAIAYFSAEKYLQAIEDSNSTIKLDPSHAEAYYLRGRSHFEMSQFVRAVDDYSQAIRIDAKNDQYLYYRAGVYASMEQYDKALADYDQLMRIKPDYVEGYLGRGSVYQELKQFSRASAEYDEAVRLAPQNTQALNSNCWVRALWGQQLAAGLEACNKAVALSPRDPNYLDSRGLIHFRMGNHRAAVRDYDAALLGDWNSSGTRYVRGLAKLKLGDTAGGRADVAAALKADPDIAKEFATFGVSP